MSAMPCHISITFFLTTKVAYIKLSTSEISQFKGSLKFLLHSTAHFNIHLVYIATALIPDTVQNLTAAVDTYNPTVTLN